MTYPIRSAAALILLLLTSLLTACGFQLRGQMDTASELKQLTVSGSDPVYIRDLSRAMEHSGIEISPQAPYQINIIRVERDADQQTAATAGYFEQRIFMTVTYQLQTSSGLPLFAPVELTRERYITQNQDTPNASESEQAIIRSELQQALIATTLRRIHSLSASALAEESEKVRALKKSSMEKTKDRNPQP